MKKIIFVIMTTLIWSGSVFACGGPAEEGQVSSVQLNDQFELLGYGLSYTQNNESKKMSFRDITSPLGSYGVVDIDLPLSISIYDTLRNKTHILKISQNEDYSLKLETTDLKTGEVKIYKGQYNLARGCNDLTVIQ
ncbi:MAG: hypothetical protein KDD50_10955 [Bdellovibrionales bacterium]|nr:hypothetical protein [Bdellovibrionales bacterium]